MTYGSGNEVFIVSKALYFSRERVIGSLDNVGTGGVEELVS